MSLSNAARATDERPAEEVRREGESLDLERLTLDPTLSDSCALYEDCDTLETAQLRMADYMTDLALARGARRVLDLRCGWGSILRRLVEVHAIKWATGLTESPAQAEHVRSLASPCLEVRVESWRRHAATAQPYDAIIASGACERVVERAMTAGERVDAFRTFFRACRRLLGRGGRLAIQTATYSDPPGAAEGRDLPLSALRLPPRGDLPRTSEVLAGCEGLFELERVRNDRRMYERTCADWLARLRAHRAQAVEVAGSDAVAEREAHLERAASLFREERSGLIRMGLRRLD